MPRGRLPTGILEVTLRDARSMTATSPPISLVTNSRGPAGALGAREQPATIRNPATTHQNPRDISATSFHDGDREAVVSLDAYGLERRRVDPPVGSQFLQEAPHPLDVLVSILV